VEQTEARFGAIDVLVNNAGYGYRAAVEEASEQDVRDLFDTRRTTNARRGGAEPRGLRKLRTSRGAVYEDGGEWSCFWLCCIGH
jgi:NAD(P)-dependent dehydrogenase (short-subunit alcohol dehydrogenase family)